MAPPKKRPARKTLADNDAFTVDGLRKVIQEKVLNSRLNMPNEDALAELARILEFWRQQFTVEQDYYRQLRELQKDARVLAEKLAASIAEINDKIEERKSAAERVTGKSAPLLIVSKLSGASKAIGFLEQLPRCSFMHESGMGADRGWQWVMDALPIDFENAMKSTNPDYAARIGRESPLTRFIAAIAPTMTGERPSANSVATLLKIRRRKQSGV